MRPICYPTQASAANCDRDLRNAYKIHEVDIQTWEWTLAVDEENDCAYYFDDATGESWWWVPQDYGLSFPRRTPAKVSMAGGAASSRKSNNSRRK